MKVNSPEYREKFRKFLEEQGPVQGSGMAASWAWKVQKERQFRERLKASGELEDEDEPADQIL